MSLRIRIVSGHEKELGESGVQEFRACGGTIGRAADNDWVLPDEKRYLSGRHALIDYQAGAYYLVDTSRNGVFINDADTAVGRGHPQRLFSGDRIRLGEYVMEVEIEDVAEAPADDGMRDSIVRAQLVPMDESAEFMLVDEDKLTDHDAFADHLAHPEASALVREVNAKARIQAINAGAKAPPAPRPAKVADSPVDQFFAAAGLKPGDLRGTDPAEAMQTAGLLLRELLGGVAELLQARARMKDSLRLPQTIIQASRNNPLKFSPGVSEALRYLLGDGGDSYLPPEQAVRAAFNDLRIHQQAIYKAMVYAIRDFTERFDPEELQRRFDRGIKRSPLLASANKLRYWELYEESYRTFVQQEEGALLPQAVAEEFVRAYEQEVELLRAQGPSSGEARPAKSR